MLSRCAALACNAGCERRSLRLSQMSDWEGRCVCGWGSAWSWRAGGTAGEEVQRHGQRCDEYDDNPQCQKPLPSALCLVTLFAALLAPGFGLFIFFALFGFVGLGWLRSPAGSANLAADDGVFWWTSAFGFLLALCVSVAHLSAPACKRRCWKRGFPAALM
jgi:hypothetical protein